MRPSATNAPRVLSETDIRGYNMLKVTNDLVLPTTMVGSYPRPLWFNENLGGRSFKRLVWEICG